MGGVLHGKSCPVNRKRALAAAASGGLVWANVEQYAVLFTVAGPPPSRQGASLRPAASHC
jgi:hypothetical protein